MQDLKSLHVILQDLNSHCILLSSDMSILVTCCGSNKSECVDLLIINIKTHRSFDTLPYLPVGSNHHTAGAKSTNAFIRGQSQDIMLLHVLSRDLTSPPHECLYPRQVAGHNVTACSLAGPNVTAAGPPRSAALLLGLKPLHS